ncbi:MAG: TIR domain-containing protein [Planctomycetes bacterium]|nr:TIR domain-containing protein [Planctomycetota bacterium]
MQDYVAESNPQFDLFISYSTDPDYRLVRGLESFLESFHRLPTPDDMRLPRLRVCVDGSDFSLTRGSGAGRGPRQMIPAEVEEYLARSTRLLVMCCPKGRTSRWVNDEVEWFLRNRGPDAILVAVSDGRNPTTAPEDVFPPAVLNAELHRRIWYDLRGLRGTHGKTWVKVRDADDERTRLAADLSGVSAGVVQPLWYRDRRRRARRQAAIASVVAVVMMIVAVIAVYFGVLAEQRRIESYGRLAERLEANGREALLQRNPERALPLLDEARTIRDQLGIVPVSLDFLIARAITPLQGRLLVLRGHTQDVERVFFASDNQRVITLGRDGLTSLWDCGSGDRLAVAMPDPSPVFGATIAAVDLRGEKLISLSSRRPHRVFLLDEDLKPHFLENGTFRPKQVAISADGSRAFVRYNTRLDLWNTADRSQLKIIETSSPRRAIDRAWFSGDDGYLVLRITESSSDRQVEYQVYNVVDGSYNGRLGPFTSESIVYPAPSFSGSRYIVLLEAGDYPRRATLWDLGECTLIREMSYNNEPLQAVRFNDNGSRLAIRFETRAELYTLPGGELSFSVPDDNLTLATPVVTDPELTLAFSSTGAFALSVNTPGSIGPMSVAVWNDAGKLIHRFPGHRSSIKALAFSNNGALLASAGADRVVKVFNVVTGQLVAEARGHKDEVLDVVFDQKGEQMLTASADSTAMLWSIDNLSQPTVVRQHIPRVSYSYNRVALVAANEEMLAVSDDQSIAAVSINDGKLSSILPADDKQIVCIAASADGRRVAVASVDRHIRLWESGRNQTRSLEPLKGYPGLSFGLMFLPTLMQFSENGAVFLAIGPGYVGLWNATTGRVVYEVDLGSSPPVCVAMTKAAEQVLVGCSDGRLLQIQREPDGTYVESTPEPHLGFVHAIAAEEGRFLTASAEGTVRVWMHDAAVTPVAEVRHGPVPVLLADFLPGGAEFVSVSEDGTVKVWATAAPNEPRISMSESAPPLGDPVFRAPRDISFGVNMKAPTALAIHPDGVIIAVASRDEGCSINVWSVESGELLAKFDHLDGGGEIRCLAFTPDGSRLLAASNLGQAWSIDVSSDPPDPDELDRILKHIDAGQSRHAP